MATTSWVNITSKNFTNGGTTSLRFKYTATRDSGSPTTVKLKLEPQVKHTSSSSNGCFVFFDKNSFTTSTTPSTYTHKCACNKTYDGSKGPYYGATGTTTASTTDDYPVDSDSWVVGAWNNVSITNISATATSLTLYFYFTNYYGFGNYVDKVDTSYQVWKNAYYGAKQNRLKFTFTIPVGYKDNEAPGEPQISGGAYVGDYSPYVGNQSLTIKWDAATPGTNNTVKSYDLYTDRWTKDGWTGYQLLKSGVTSGCTVTRSEMTKKFGAPNTRYTKGVNTGWWEDFDFKVYANPSKGSTVTVSDYSESCVWNEAPGSPSAVWITVNGNRSPDAVPKIPANLAINAKVHCSGAIDRFMPSISDYGSGHQNPTNYKIVFGSGKTKIECIQTDGETEWPGILVDNSWSHSIPTDYGINYAPGGAAHYYYAYAQDGQLESSVATMGSYYIGQRLVLGGAIVLRDESNLPTDEINKNTHITVPRIYMDAVSNKCCLYNTSVYYYLKAKKSSEGNDKWKTIGMYTQSSSKQLEETVNFGYIYNLLTTYYPEDMGFASQEFNFQVEIVPKERTDTRIVADVVGANDSQTFIKPAIGFSTEQPLLTILNGSLIYAYKEYKPVVDREHILVTGGTITGPAGLDVQYWLEHSEFNNAITSPQDVWTVYASRTTTIGSTGALNWNETISVNTLFPSSTITAKKMRLRFNVAGETKIFPLAWPSLTAAMNAAQQTACHAIVLFESIDAPYLLNSFIDNTQYAVFEAFDEMPNSIGEYKQTNSFDAYLPYTGGDRNRAFRLSEIDFENETENNSPLPLIDSPLIFSSKLPTTPLLSYRTQFVTEREETQVAVYGKFSNISVIPLDNFSTFADLDLINALGSSISFPCNTKKQCLISFGYQEAFSMVPGWDENTTTDLPITYGTVKYTPQLVYSFSAETDMNVSSFKESGTIQRANSQEGGE